jgi:hypothetical protein
MWSLFHSILHISRNRWTGGPFKPFFGLSGAVPQPDIFHSGSRAGTRSPPQSSVYRANSAIEFILWHLAPKPLRGRGPSVSLFEDFFRRILFLIDPNRRMIT